MDSPPVPDPLQSTLQQKWGPALDARFQVIPTVLIHAQSRLGLDSVDLAVLLNLISHWWELGSHPYVSPATVAKRISVDTRTVERHIKKLEEKGFIHRRTPQRTLLGTGETIYIRNYDLTPLVEILAEQGRQTLTLRAQRPQFNRA